MLNLAFVRKYISFARHNVDPKLSEESRESIANAYADLRSKSDDRTLPVTARCLESLIRIATAHSKVRLSNIVDGRDCHAALKFLSFALYGDAKLGPHEVNALSRSFVNKDDFAIEATGKRLRKTSDADSQSSHASLQPHVDDVGRHKILVDAYTQLASINATRGKVHINELLTLANSFLSKKDRIFQSPEIEVILHKLQDENRLMYDESKRDIHFL